MNTIVTHASPATYFHPTWQSVEAISTDGAPFTFAKIYRNKHGRTNLCGIDGRFIAGGKGAKAVEKYARTVDPATTRKVFIERGEIREV